MSPMVSWIASAIFVDLLRSPSLIEVSLESFGPVSSSSSANPATYMSIASSTVILSAFETGLDCWSTVKSVIEVLLVNTLLLSVLVVSIRLDLVVRADRKLDLTSSLLYVACHGLIGKSFKSSNGEVDNSRRLFSHALLFTVGFGLDSPPAVDGLVNCGWAGELLYFGAVTEAPRSRGPDVNSDRIRSPILVSCGRPGKVGE